MAGTSSPLRRTLGPVVRRARREAQWWRVGRRRLALTRSADAAADGFGCMVAEHSTPIYRVLAGLDGQLQRNKAVNLRIATARLDGLVLAPGQCLSFWWHVRRPSRRRGFLDGLVLADGRLTAGVGGGLCQLTNLLYWMTLHTPLSVTERWRHSHDVFPDAGRTQPFGSGATCAWPSLDLQIENPTNVPFRLAVTTTATDLVGAWTSVTPAGAHYEVYEVGHAITNDLPGVFVRRNELRRRCLDGDGLVVADEFVTANAARLRYAPFLAGPARDDGSPVPVASTDLP